MNSSKTGRVIIRSFSVSRRQKRLTYPGRTTAPWTTLLLDYSPLFRNLKDGSKRDDVPTRSRSHSITNAETTARPPSHTWYNQSRGSLS